ncbi:hypothetical protein [Trichothermofontia sp.]
MLKQLTRWVGTLSPKTTTQVDALAIKS